MDWPYCVHGIIVVLLPEGKQYASGTVISDYYVLTPAHNLYDKRIDKFPVDYIQFLPAIDGINLHFGEF
jgi:hypothetical protein